jgi:hypothetical protein
MVETADKMGQESLDIRVEPNLVVMVKRLTELVECIRRALAESEEARERSDLMGLNEVTHELDIGRVRLSRARQLLERHLTGGEPGR